MNAAKPVTPRRSSHKMTSSSVRPDDFLPMRRAKKEESSSTLLNSLRLKLEHDKGQEVEEANGLWENIRSRLETPSSCGSKEEETILQQHQDNNTISSESSRDHSLASGRQTVGSGTRDVTLGARPQDFLRAQDVDLTPRSRKAAVGGFNPYSPKKGLSQRRKELESDSFDLAALARARERRNHSSPVKKREFLSSPYRKTEDSELDLEELKSQRTAKTEAMHESDTSLTMAGQFSLSGGSIAFGSESYGNLNFNNSEISGMEDSFRSTDSNPRATNTTPSRNIHCNKITSLRSPAQDAVTPRGSLSPRRTRSKPSASVVASVSPPPLELEDEAQEASTVESNPSSKDTETTTSKSSEELSREASRSCSSDDSSSGQQQQRPRRRSRSGKKKKKSKLRTLKVSKNEFAKLNAFLAQQGSEREDVNTVDTDSAKIFSEEGSLQLSVPITAAATTTTSNTNSATSPRGKGKTIRRVPVSRASDDSQIKSMAAVAAAAAAAPQLSTDGDDESDNEEEVTFVPAWASRKLKSTPQGEILKKTGADLAKPITATRPPVLYGLDDDNNSEVDSGTVDATSNTPSVNKKKKNTKSLRLVDSSSKTSFDDDDVSEFSAPSFNPKWAGSSR